MKGILVALFLLCPVLAFAQSPCDKPPLSGTITIFTPAFPFAIKVPSGITTTAFKITVDGTKSDLTVTPTTANTAGDQCFLASVTVSGNGNHNIDTSYTPSGGVEVFSTNPFVLKFVDPRPVNHPR